MTYKIILIPTSYHPQPFITYSEHSTTPYKSALSSYPSSPRATYGSPQPIPNPTQGISRISKPYLVTVPTLLGKL